MVGPEDAENPDTDPELPVAVQVKVVPATVPVRFIFVVPPEQTENVVVELDTAGLGLTVTRK